MVIFYYVWLANFEPVLLNNEYSSIGSEVISVFQKVFMGGLGQNRFPNGVGMWDCFFLGMAETDLLKESFKQTETLPGFFLIILLRDWF